MYDGGAAESVGLRDKVLQPYNDVNNPDEKTAVEQFGTGDKYFGVATLMATMPDVTVQIGTATGKSSKVLGEFTVAGVPAGTQTVTLNRASLPPFYLAPATVTVLWAADDRK